MAKDLNKTRMRDTRILVVMLLLTALLTKPVIPEGSLTYISFKLLGYFLLTTCAVGRIYSTAFIGGIKNEKLMTHGPYSMCRNPLYFYSLLGAAGLGFMSVQMIPLAIVLGGFLFVYNSLISREEGFLKKKFGAEFEAYQASTPRLLPDIRKYTSPAELLFQPKYFNYAIRDAVWWFAPAPFFELTRLLHTAGIIKPLFSLL